MNVRPVVSALVLTLVATVAALPAEAQRRGGGGSRGGSNGGSRGGSNGGSNGGSRGGSYSGSHGGGGSNGGSYGRSHGGGGSHGGEVAHYRGGAYAGAQARHPRPGTGTGYKYGGYYGYGRHGGYYGSYYRPYYYGGYYAPYYGYGYGGFYGSLSFGWPSYSSPYYSAGYSYSPSYDVSYAAPAREYDDRQSEAPRELDRSSEADPSSGRVRLEVRPEDASVYVDDAFRGTAREAKGLILPAGRHTIELVRPGFMTERREVEVATRASQDLLVEMQRR